LTPYYNDHSVVSFSTNARKLQKNEDERAENAPHHLRLTACSRGREDKAIARCNTPKRSQYCGQLKGKDRKQIQLVHSRVTAMKDDNANQQTPDAYSVKVHKHDEVTQIYTDLGPVTDCRLTLWLNSR